MSRYRMHNIFEKPYRSWSELEAEIHNIEGNKEKGDAFEQFAAFYFKFFSRLYQIDEFYCPVVSGEPYPRQVLSRLNLEKKDHGVDCVFRTREDKWVAIQVKFRGNRAGLTYGELSTFWTEAECSDVRLIFSNVGALPTISDKKSGHAAILADLLEALDEDFFKALQQYSLNQNVIVRRERKEPRDYQQEILNDVISGLSNHNKGKLIAACGIGKTMVALWLVEQRGDASVLFMAPNLQLVRQTLGEWAKEAGDPFRYLCVCSDATVDLEDESDIKASSLDIPVTTDQNSISKFLQLKGSERKVIFSTYQSVPVLSEALKKSGFKFDLAIYDEAHRTAGARSSNLFSLAIEDGNIPARKRLFMTATERVVAPRIKNTADEMNHVVFSMDDIEKYGPVFHRLSFGQAIGRKVISDYRIIFSGITNNELAGYVKENKFVIASDSAGNIDETDSAQMLFKRVLLRKCLDELSLRKVITFHNKIPEAQRFAKSLEGDLKSVVNGRLAVEHVNGAMSAQSRSILIREFKNADIGILTNVRCLTEGVDIPIIDAVFFANPRSSLIDIVQAVGRALRQPFGSKGKIAYIIIPILLDESNQSSLLGDAFETLFNVIQALREQDEGLAEWIDHINLSAVSGSARVSKGGKVRLLLPASFDVDEFTACLLLKIADVNRDPIGHVGIGSKLGKAQRKSTYTRVFKTLCDYTPEKLNESLISPTLNLIKKKDGVIKAADIRINNNNVSHCERLGVLHKLSTKEYILTDLGNKLRLRSSSFNDAFRNQMLLYSCKTPGGIYYPYREALKYMSAVSDMGFIDFVYGIYSLQVDPYKGVLLQDAINVSIDVKRKYPRIELTSESNKQQILDALNANHPVGFPYVDVWTDRTTTGNQFRYLCRHLELFDEVFYFEGKRLRVQENGYKIIEEYLDITNPLLGTGYGSSWWLDGRKLG